MNEESKPRRVLFWTSVLIVGALVTYGVYFLADHAELLPTPVTEIHAKSATVIDGVVHVSRNDPTFSEVQSLPTQWRFHEGHDPEWTSPDYDDSEWAIRTTYTTKKQEIMPSCGWFRLTFQTDSTVAGQSMALYPVLIGAAELYLDGSPILEVGHVSDSHEKEELYFLGRFSTPVSIRLDTPGRHVLAVRFSNHHVEDVARQGGLAGFQFLAAWSDGAKDKLRKRSFWHVGLHFMLAGVGMALFWVHIVLFIFDPRKKVNLAHSIFTLFGSITVIIAAIALSAKMPLAMIGVLMTGSKTLIVLIPIVGSWVLFSLFSDRFPKRFWGKLVVGMVLIIFIPIIPMKLLNIFAIIVFIDWLGVVISAIRRGVRDAWILGVGYVGLAVSFGLTLFYQLRHINPSFDFQEYYLFGYDLLLLTMTIYIAHSMVKTNRALEDKISENKELFEQSLKHEREIRDQEVREAVLAKELEEAREKQSMMAELEKTNRELRDTQAQLIQSGKMASLGSLVAGVAHEINTPIGAIHSMQDTLVRAFERMKSVLNDNKGKNCLDDPEVQKSVELIDEANRVISTGSIRVTEIVRRLRSFARLDEAELQLADLKEGLEDSLLLVHHEIKDRIEIVRDYGDLPMIHCFPRQLNQVFLNLLMNAGQAIPDEGRITIRTGLEDGFVKVIVSDTGTGILPEHLDRIFDPGFTTKGVKIGTGLGLSIVYRIVKEHRGEVLVKSKPGEGSTFTVSLPTDLEELLAAEPKSAERDSE